MAKIDSLEKLMVEELRDILDAEKQVAKSLPKMARAASADELRALFEEHRRQTADQLGRLNDVFRAIGSPARGKKCKGMQALIAEGQEMMAETEEGPARDAALIASAQKVEHYEMAAYGTLRTWASLLGYEEAAGLLEETLEQEKKTDAKLTAVAEAVANPEAAVEEPSRARSRKVSAGARSGRTASSRGRKATGARRSSGGAKRGGSRARR